MNKKEKAVEFFKKGYNCSQSVFVAFNKEFGLTEDVCLKTACAFGAGMGRNQHTCGAVTGALMVLGLRFGKGVGDDESKKKYTYSKVDDFFADFIRINGSISCRELLSNFDLRNEVDYAEIVKQNLFELKCEKYVADAVEITEKLIE